MVQSTGVFRRMDDLGRIVIPKEARILLNLKEGSPMEVFCNTEEREVIFRTTDIPINYGLMWEKLKSENPELSERMSDIEKQYC